MTSISVSAESKNYKVETLIEKNFVNGYEDKSLRLDKPITRAEFTKLIVEVKRERAYANKLSDEASIFKDVTKESWANGYINCATKDGYIKGYNDMTFKPQKNITNREAIAIVARLHPDFKEKNLDETDWSKDYLNFAKNHGILEDIHIDDCLDDNATREIAFEIIYNYDREIDNIIEEIVRSAMKDVNEEESSHKYTYGNNLQVKSGRSESKEKNIVRFYDEDKLLFKRFFYDGEYLKFLNAPEKDGYNFVAWYNEGKKVDFPLRVSSDLSLNAKYEKVKINNEDYIKDLQNLLKDDLLYSENIDKIDGEILNLYKSSLYYAKDLLKAINDGKEVDLKTIKSATLNLNAARKNLKAELWKLNSKEEVRVESIRINSKNHKTKYEVGDALDLNGLTIEVKNSDGSVKTVEVTDDMVSGFNSNKPKDLEVLTINYRGKTTNYNIKIVEKEPKADIVWIKIISTNHKTEYKVNDKLDTKNLKILVKRDDYSLEEIDVKPDMVDGFDSKESINSKKLAINYEGKTVNYDIKIIEEERPNVPKLKSIKIPLNVKYEFDPNILNYVVEVDDDNIPIIGATPEDEEKVKKEVIHAKDFDNENVTTVKLISEDNIINTYTVKFIRKPKIVSSSNKHLKSIKVGDKIIEVRDDTVTYKINLNKTEELPEVDAIPQDLRNTVEIVQAKDSESKDCVIIYVVSEKGKTLGAFQVKFYFTEDL